MNYFLSNAIFYLSTCTEDLVGDKKIDPNCKHSWSSDSKHKFEQWQHHRIWGVEELTGHAYAKTTFAEFEIKEKKCYFIPAGTIVETSCVEGVMKQFHIEFLINSIVPLSFSQNSFSYASNDFDLISLLLKKLQINFIPNSADDFTNSVMKIILSCFNVQNTISHRSTPFIPVLKYINENYTQKINIDDLSALVGYTNTYFSTKFTDLFGISPNKFIENKRIEHAKLLLLSSKQSIFEISELCGYLDIYYFSKRFKIATGYTPSNFRKLFQYSLDKR